MRGAPPTSVSWAVSHRPHGEVLAVEERAPHLTLWLLGQPENSTGDELHGWLHDVAAVAAESAAQDATPQPIPALLRHALSGLLFSHSEMWSPNSAAPPLCSIAFTSAGDELGFGWIGDAVVTVLIDGQPADVRWVLVRDDRGRQARAWSIAHGHDVRVRLTWSPDPTDPSGPVVVLEAATSQGPHAAPSPGSSVPIPDVRPSDPVPGAEPPTTAIDEFISSEPDPFFASPERVEEELEARITALESAATGATTPDVERVALPPVEVIGTPAAEEAVPSPVKAADETTTDPGAAPPVRETSAVTPHLDPAVATPERPSSGIARWLSRNFAWLGRGGHSGQRAAPPPGRPRPAPAEAPAPAPPAAEQQDLPGIEPVHSASAPAPHPDEPSPGSAIESHAPVIDAMTEATAAHEDALAATAAALAAALGGLDVLREEIETRESVSDPVEPVESPRGFEPGVATPEAPERIFDVLPEQIPPSPEPASLTARAVRLDLTPARDPREIALPGDEAPAVVSVPAPAPSPSLPPRLVPMNARVPRPVADVSDVDVDPRTLRSLDANASAALDADEFPPPSSVPDLEIVSSYSAPPAPPAPPAAAPEPAAPEPAAIDTPAFEAPAPPAAIANEPPVAIEATETVAAIEMPTPVEAPADAPGPAHDSAPEDDFAPASRRVRTRHPDWPSEAEIRPEVARHPRSTWIALGAVIAVLFGAGWLVGSLQWNRTNAKDPRGPFGALLGALGVRPPSYHVDVRSQPDGAWILVDGKPTQQRTPAALDVPPGHHDITLSFGEWGQSVYPVDGVRGAQRRVDGTLWGSLDLGEPEPGVVVSVAVDGRPRGFAPLVVDSLAPGPHQVRFSGPGLPSWGETVEIRTGEQHHMLARTVTSPATGLIEVRATLGGAPGSGDLAGARVWIDGQPRGATPLTLELPRGPHSVRVEYQGERVPVQLLDLPGGNQRFATFVFGSGAEFPQLTVEAPAKLSATETPVVSATLRDMEAGDVRELWLHVRGPDGNWNRYPMTRLEGQLHAVGAVTFPVSSLDPEGQAPWYVSAVTAQGDEYFTEIQTMQDGRKKPR